MDAPEIAERLLTLLRRALDGRDLFLLLSFLLLLNSFHLVNGASPRLGLGQELIENGRLDQEEDCGEHGWGGVDVKLATGEGEGRKKWARREVGTKRRAKGEGESWMNGRD